jgi:hypothetical protein
MYEACYVINSQIYYMIKKYNNWKQHFYIVLFYIFLGRGVGVVYGHEKICATSMYIYNLKECYIIDYYAIINNLYPLVFVFVG